MHVGNLVARTSRAAELAAVSRAVMWTRTHVSFAQEHARGEPHVAPQRALGAANRRARSRLSEGDETQKYAIESRRAAVYRVAHAKHSTLTLPAPLGCTLYHTLQGVEGRDFTPQYVRTISLKPFSLVGYIGLCLFGCLSYGFKHCRVPCKNQNKSTLPHRYSKASTCLIHACNTNTNVSERCHDA